MAAKSTLKGSNRVVAVKVTQPLIDQAQRQDSSHCMVADAIRAALPDVKSIAVDVTTIRFTDPAKRQRYIYLTPRTVQLALIDFDQGVPAEPFSFELRKAVQVVSSGERKMPDGTRQQASRAIEKIVGGSDRRQPTKLGGELPPVGALSSKPSRRKPVVAADIAKAATAKVPAKKLTAAEKRAAALKTAEKQVAARDRGEPVTKTDSNITLAQTATRIRKFGMRQLRP